MVHGNHESPFGPTMLPLWLQGRGSSKDITNEVFPFSTPIGDL